jgi:hypothetical protein
MSTKSQAPQGEDMLHSSAEAFEVRHQARVSSEREGGFTRRCGRRAPADKSPCMYVFGHDGRHAWEQPSASNIL